MQYAAAAAGHVTFSEDADALVEETLFDDKLGKILQEKMGITTLFQMQRKLFSHIHSQEVNGQTGDVVLRAPTGSGKTLAYALPIVQQLRSRKVPRLDTIVVVPTRDLAAQVAEVFQILTRDVGISVQVAVGTSSTEVESRNVCNAEILVATPGRLVFHVNGTKAFNLRYVRNLVLDESDRLLEDSYQSWINKILPVLGDRFSTSDSASVTRAPLMGMVSLAMVPQITAKSSSRYSGRSHVGVRKFLISATQTTNPMRLQALDLRKPMFFVPELRTLNPAEKRESGPKVLYTVPSKLKEQGWVVKDLQEKLGGLFVLLGWVEPLSSEQSRKNDQGNTRFEKNSSKLIFTNSVESAHRLCRLLEICAYALDQDGMVLEMSGDLSLDRRKYVVEKIKEVTHANAESRKKSDSFLIVVCSDVLARGMDMVNIDTIINYDAPVHIEKYIHRAGRTARAGQPGTVFTLLLEKQAHHFRAMIHEADRGNRKVITRNLTVKGENSTAISEAVSIGLKSLRRVLNRERLGLLERENALPMYALHDFCLDLATESRRSHSKHQQDTQLIDLNKGMEDVSTAYQRSNPYPFDEEGRNETDFGSMAAPANEETDAGDDFQDLLFSQIARNLGSTNCTV